MDTEETVIEDDEAFMIQSRGGDNGGGEKADWRGGGNMILMSVQLEG